MLVGLSDGTLEFFKLVPRNHYIYYQHIKTINLHEDSINGLHLDKVNMVAYTTSLDGYLHIFDFRNGVLIDSKELH
jgi:WD40 repeat protein